MPLRRHQWKDGKYYFSVFDHGWDVTTDPEAIGSSRAQNSSFGEAAMRKEILRLAEENSKLTQILDEVAIPTIIYAQERSVSPFYGQQLRTIARWRSPHSGAPITSPSITSSGD